MNNNLQPVNNNNQQVAAVISADSQNQKSDGDHHKAVGQKLLEESVKHSNESKQKSDQALQFLHAAEALEKAAEALRLKAQEIKSGKVGKEKGIKEVEKTVQAVLQIPIPKDATPEMLLDMADKYEEKAKENRVKANDLLIQSEESAKLAVQLEKQVLMVNNKDMKLNELSFKQAAAHNEGLNMVFKKLGIYKLDAEYKVQVEYASKKAKEQGLPT